MWKWQLWVFWINYRVLFTSVEISLVLTILREIPDTVLEVRINTVVWQKIRNICSPDAKLYSFEVVRVRPRTKPSNSMICVNGSFSHRKSIINVTFPTISCFNALASSWRLEAKVLFIYNVLKISKSRENRGKLTTFMDRVWVMRSVYLYNKHKTVNPTVNLFTCKRNLSLLTVNCCQAVFSLAWSVFTPCKIVEVERLQGLNGSRPSGHQRRGRSHLIARSVVGPRLFNFPFDKFVDHLTHPTISWHSFVLHCNDDF